MLEKIKVLLGIADNDSSKDELLEYLISDAEHFVCSYCRCSNYNSEFDTVVVKMVLEDYNKLGLEGVQSRSFSGLSESYNSNYSDDIYALLKTFRRVIVL